MTEKNNEIGADEMSNERLPIGENEVAAAYALLLKYKAGKANLEKRIIEAQQWYKLRQWECLRKRERTNQPEPASAWLFNAIANKHADAMDAFPSASILPREAGDEAEAEMLTAVVPVVLDGCDFESVYSGVMDDKLITGTGVYGVFWDAEKLNGLGDIDIVQTDVINLFWESGVQDIQHSRNLFHVSLRDNDILQEEYPQLVGKLAAPAADMARYIYDDSVDTTGKSIVVDWYYKKRQGGRTLLHYCKFIAGQNDVLYATENDREPIYDALGNVKRAAPCDTGWYDHGLYPFVFDPLFRSKGTPCGFGYIDVGKNTQEFIDRGDQAIMQNMLFNCKPRHFIRNDGSVNEEEYGDVTKDFVHVDGALGQDSIMPVRTNTLDSIYVTVINNKIDELKETTGNRDVSSGGTTGGATAAAAIAAMQEAGSKLSRDASKAAYRAYKRLVLMVIELIRQFYDVPRYFRIMGQKGGMKFISCSNERLRAQSLGEVSGLEMGTRLPVFDVCVTAVKASPYSRLSQNELALQFYAAGFFDPERADAALSCLDMMDFDRKDFVMAKIAENAAIKRERDEQARRAAMLSTLAGNMPAIDADTAEKKAAAPREVKVPSTQSGESASTRRAREKTAEAVIPA